MPAPLVPDEDIPKLAGQIDSPALLRVLRLLQGRDFIHNGPEIDEETAALLKRLVQLRLADPGYDGPADGAPFIWVGNGNGERVLRYLEQNRRYKLEVSARARTALESLPQEDREAIRGAVEALLTFDPASWPPGEVVLLNSDKRAFLLKASPELTAFLRIVTPGTVELSDVVREDTLRLFLERQHVGGKVG